MWSAGRKRVRLYLGRRVALLQVTGHGLLTIERPPTQPIQAALAQLTAMAEQQGIALQGASLDVDLGAALCKAVSLPADTHSVDLSSLATHHANALAAQLPWPAEQWAFPLKASKSGLMAVTTHGTLRSLEAWAVAHKMKMGSMQPLWALITQSQRLASEAVHSAALIEPDGALLFGEALPAQPNAKALWHFVPDVQWTEASPVLFSLMAEHQIDKSMTPIFRFAASQKLGNEPGLAAWAGHWGQA